MLAEVRSPTLRVRGTISCTLDCKGANTARVTGRHKSGMYSLSALACEYNALSPCLGLPIVMDYNRERKVK